MRTRFAPSPTGPLHLGHAFAALTAFERAGDGEMLLRIEDIDSARSRPEWEAQIYDDLTWLGLDWPRPVLRQSDRLAAYRDALDRLGAMGLTYPCRCRRADIRAALSAPQAGAPVIGPDGLVYPGTCRGRSLAEAGPEDAIRLDMARALDRLGPALPAFTETGAAHAGRHMLEAQALIGAVGDVVLARRDLGTSYHLAVVVDDAFQEIGEVTRGEDLFEATPIHVLLQALLGLPTPAYHHHRLILDETGRRLAKRDDARAIAAYRAEGASPADIRGMVGL
ncbi:tRNA glutamyl-Q(34) synthetase GluQRS [Rhodovulum sulfidophilum]|uniref:tRNA glutamyl-Q(34) synthetase GluQRS n=1 Tax=Rhodovulum sulfidophilum TaxID=35806 RepID=UPI0019244893|nr:tRNA glutamyl-Q(34) synthetase GluQRS [Rhodovulum sulfidophilum]MBL3573148.1 tRNA glutamyl-Q(34) synthetase GluQRS [Rhodovulum sulfidophilum]MCE8432946.1 tRNA glutamyl-Q(34) synthetase GluQRS [Rhodovulum sulfidophilum]MCF4116751.1 tRNA glutamyl-Q(34) synthetase GluQRS [Rhodovulum sulfidophilum]